jgi:hypothetical protein
MSGASWSLQQAIYSTLSASSDLQALVGSRVFDLVPRESAFPYAVIGDDAETNWDTATESGSQHIVAVDIWSRSGGHKESKAIADVVRLALDGASLAPGGQTLVGIRYQGTDFARQTDGETYRATLHFRAVMEPA